MRENKWSDPRPYEDPIHETLLRPSTADETGALRIKQIRFVLISFSVWLVPILLLYLIGAGIGCVIAGFRAEKHG